MPDIWQLVSVLAKFLLYLGVLSSVGLVLVRAVFRRETGPMDSPLRRRAAALAVLALLAGALGFVLKAAMLAGEASGMADPEMLGLLWETPAGTRLILLAAGIALVLAGLWGGGLNIWIAAGGGLLALWSFSHIGHVADAGTFWLDALLLLHLALAAFWIGILSPLRALAAAEGRLAGAAALGRRFGRIATVTVPLLIAAGLVMAWRLVGDPAALLATGYGLALLAKVTGVGVLLAAAAANKLRFVPAMERDEAPAAAGLRRSIALEWVAVWAILFVTAGLTVLATPPS